MQDYNNNKMFIIFLSIWVLQAEKVGEGVWAFVHRLSFLFTLKAWASDY